MSSDQPIDYKILSEHYKTQFMQMHRRAQKAEGALIKKANEGLSEIPGDKVQRITYAAILHELNNALQLNKLYLNGLERVNNEMSALVREKAIIHSAFTTMVTTILGRTPDFPTAASYSEVANEALVVVLGALEDQQKKDTPP